MKKQNKRGIEFGFHLFIILLIFLTGLTTFLICDKIKVELENRKVIKTIVLPPIIEGMEVYDYE